MHHQREVSLMSPAPEARRDLPLMSEADKLRFCAEFADDVLSKLSDALFEVADVEGWTKRDLATIVDMNETQLGRYLSGQKSNMNIKTLALLSRVLRKRPELTLHDDRLDSEVRDEDGQHTGHDRRQITQQSGALGKGWEGVKQKAEGRVLVGAGE